MNSGAQKIMQRRPGAPKCRNDASTNINANVKEIHARFLLSSMNTKNGNNI